MLFYQDRLDTQSLSIAGNSSATQLSGTTYAPQAQLKITGQGNYNSQFIIGSMTIAGGGTLTLNYAGQNLGKASEVFLVE
jgi:hypothetical protein